MWRVHHWSHSLPLFWIGRNTGQAAIAISPICVASSLSEFIKDHDTDGTMKQCVGHGGVGAALGKIDTRIKLFLPS